MFAQSLTSSFRHNLVNTIIKTPSYCVTRELIRRGYAGKVSIPGLGKSKGKLGKIGGPTLEKKILPVETDVNKLVSEVAGSCIYNKGENIKLKPDSEYPDWLWELRVGPDPPLSELDPETEEYWERVKKEDIRRSQKLQKLKKF